MTVLTRLTADDMTTMDGDRHAQVIDWAKANGIDPYQVALRDLTIEQTPAGTVVRYQQMRQAPTGGVLVDPVTDDVITDERTVPLHVPYPAAA